MFPCCMINTYWAYPHHYYRQIFPEVKTTMLLRSAKEAHSLMADGQRILNRLASSQDLARRIMTAAQSSQKETVKSLLRQTGIHSQLDVSFNPDGIHIVLINPYSTMSLILRWS
ncbi:hypothetical protein OZL92_10525 [Bacillus sonorensis]|nr:MULTISPECIES: hypothetical protein [Bacillus]ASB90582.1 uncharacterized protein S101395_04080 [Bacillus sonorensis]MCF7616776.1 hypothetical protein [Bacillus sonorensis]MCY8026322.1 hypothetical protein [Bacillus sonorensis]MCY8033823.1 hypothetical protein [Bacillus sonorensis]MCY8086121.1 hypothetical protein [Bacillus sonorensis]